MAIELSVARGAIRDIVHVKVDGVKYKAKSGIGCTNCAFSGKGRCVEIGDALDERREIDSKGAAGCGSIREYSRIGFVLCEEGVSKREVENNPLFGSW